MSCHSERATNSLKFPVNWTIQLTRSIITAPATTAAMLENLHHLFPDTLAELPSLRFIEQYDPADETIKSQPFAYVADIVEEVKTGVEIAEITGRGVAVEQWEAMMDLRDHLQKDAKVAWYMVVCGDEERWVPPQSPLSEVDEDLETSTTSPKSPTASKSSGSRSDTFASSSKSTQYTSSPISTREQKNRDQRSAPPAKASSSSRTKTSSDSRSSTKPAPPPMSRTATTESRGKQKERDPEIRRVCLRIEICHTRLTCICSNGVVR